MDALKSQLTRLKWITIIVPAAGVFAYETVRHDFLEEALPTNYGNVVVGLLTLLMAYVFAEVIFASIGRLQDLAVAREREVAYLTATAREQERLSRDLHDGLAQVISYLMMRLDTVESLVRTGRSVEAQGELEKLREVTNELYVDVRDSISGLRTRVSETGLVRALQTYADEFEDRHGLPVSIVAEESMSPVPAEINLQLFRIVQEALANIRRHAHANQVTVRVDRRENSVLEVRIADDGQGFDPSNMLTTSQSLGLASMRERTELLGGVWDIQSKVGAGTTVVVKVPLPRTGEESRGRHEDTTVAR